MSYFDPHGLNRQYSRRTQRKGQVLQSRLLDPRLTIDNHLVPVYLRYIIKNNLYPNANPLPIKLNNLNFSIPDVVDVDFTLEDVINTWEHRQFRQNGQFWEMSNMFQPLYSFWVGVVSLPTGIVFYVSGTIGDNSQDTGVPIGFRMPLSWSQNPPMLFYRQLALTPVSTSPYFGYLSISTGSQSIVLSGRQFYYVDDTVPGRRYFYPTPQFLPRSIFDSDVL